MVNPENSPNVLEGTRLTRYSPCLPGGRVVDGPDEDVVEVGEGHDDVLSVGGAAVLPLPLILVQQNLTKIYTLYILHLHFLKKGILFHKNSLLIFLSDRQHITLNLWPVSSFWTASLLWKRVISFPWTQNKLTKLVKNCTIKSPWNSNSIILNVYYVPVSYGIGTNTAVLQPCTHLLNLI